MHARPMCRKSWHGSSFECCGQAAATSFQDSPFVRCATLVAKWPASDGAPQLCGGRAVVPHGGIAHAGTANRRALPGLSSRALKEVGVALALPGHHGNGRLER